jgi:phytoene dehydrogenase-like protein
VAPLLESTPPDLTDPAAGELWNLLKTGRRFRHLGRTDGFTLLRWTPMAVADLVAEWFSTDLLQAAVASRGIAGTAMGPWSGGTGAVLLLNAAHDPLPAGSAVTVRGGPGTLSSAMADAAREAGAEIRTSSPVARVIVRDGRASGVVLGSGEEIAARAVVSGADPRRTLLDLVDPGELEPAFLVKIRNYRCPGVVAKVNLAVSALPAFSGVTSPADLGGRLHIGPDIDYLERAFDASKYGRISPAPYLDVMIPSLHDPSLAPTGHHVLSVYVQYAPYRLANGLEWETQRESLARVVMDTLDRYAPGIERLVVHRQVITPVDLERTYGFTGGHVFHGEPSLDQLYATRPVLGCAQYATPIAGLFLCGAGTHPGGGITGASGQNAAREIVRTLK